MRTPRPRGASQPKAGSREARAPRLCPEGQLRPSPARRDLAPRNAARPPPHRLAGRPARPPPAPPLRPARPRGEPPSHRCPPRVQNGGGGVQSGAGTFPPRPRDFGSPPPHGHRPTEEILALPYSGPGVPSHRASDWAGPSRGRGRAGGGPGTSESPPLGRAARAQRPCLNASSCWLWGRAAGRFKC